MRIAYFDCFSGISGDMCLGALISAGVDFDRLKEELTKLPVEGYALRWEKVKRNGITSANFFVDMLDVEQPERRLADIHGIKILKTYFSSFSFKIASILSVTSRKATATGDSG
jgi:uncharacterized protein (DUF111 family)